MKKIFLLALIPAMVLGGCKKFIEDFDESPNNPTVVTAPLLLTASQVSTFTSYTGQLGRFSAMMTQQTTGTDFQMLDYANYNIGEGDVNNEWSTIYSEALIDAKTLVDQFGADNPYYTGIAKVLMAMNLGIATDFWGDVPYSQALQGLENFSPSFDSQEDIIASIQTLCDEAIAHFGAAPEENVILPSFDDLVFAGDVAQWTKTAWIIKARYALRLSKKDASAAAQAALDNLTGAMDAGLAGPEDDCNAIFGDAGNELNQWYAFQNSRGGYMKMSEHLVTMMQGISDPRIPFYCTLDTSGTYSGTPLGSVDQSTSDVGSYFASPSNPLPLVTYVEAKFIEAEANMILGNGGPAADAHNAAVAAHVMMVTGASDPVFEAAQAAETSATISMEKILMHKYIAMFSHVEAYSDWRRTDYPSLSPNPNGILNAIPRRLPMSGDERVNNPNATVVNDILSPVWWDE